jgi:hypothetical protein
MKDKLHSMGSHQAQTSAFKLLDALQRLPQHEQVSALILSFLLICKRFDYNPREACELGERILSDCLSKGRGEQARALINYMKGEL